MRLQDAADNRKTQLAVVHPPLNASVNLSKARPSALPALVTLNALKKQPESLVSAGGGDRTHRWSRKTLQVQTGRVYDSGTVATGGLRRGGYSILLNRSDYASDWATTCQEQRVGTSHSA